MRKVLFFFCVFLFYVTNVFAVDLMLPFEGGKTWRCDQGNYNDSKNIWGCYAYTDENGDGVVRNYYNVSDDTNGDGKVDCSDSGSDYKMQWSNPTHRVNSSMEYAWDFNFGSVDSPALFYVKF
jgi:hypothetical protein